MFNRVRESKEASVFGKETPEGILLNEKAEDLPGAPAGCFTRLPDGRIAAAGGKPARLHITEDEGKTWTERPVVSPDADLEPAPSGAFMITSAGTLIWAFANIAERHWTWDDELRDAPGARLPTWVIRSLDGGETWQDAQKLHEDWTGANRDIIETRDGRIVFTSMKMLHHPGRHSVLTYSSTDDGETWRPSNLIDLGGCGHHGGMTEATLVELKDGRLLKYIRTNWEQFWLAWSRDGGRSWHPWGPSGVDASSAPGMLKRLASGRIALAWNRAFPEGENSHPPTGGNGISSAAARSNFRKELSLSFSEDECESWSPPVVVARREEREISYPYIFEASPGELWISAHRWDFHVKLREEDFLR